MIKQREKVLAILFIVEMILIIWLIVASVKAQELNNNTYKMLNVKPSTFTRGTNITSYLFSMGAYQLADTTVGPPPISIPLNYPKTYVIELKLKNLEKSK